MTDKYDIDQNNDALREAFKHINNSDDLQPPAELDALILKQASDALVSQKTEVKHENTNVSDLSFRRNQRAEQKKKKLFPSWMMPMGLAATVLLSFGVVNRVLQAPEFFKPMNEHSAAVYEDAALGKSDDTRMNVELSAVSAEATLAKETAAKASTQGINSVASNTADLSSNKKLAAAEREDKTEQRAAYTVAGDVVEEAVMAESVYAPAPTPVSSVTVATSDENNIQLPSKTLHAEVASAAPTISAPVTNAESTNEQTLETVPVEETLKRKEMRAQATPMSQPPPSPMSDDIQGQAAGASIDSSAVGVSSSETNQIKARVPTANTRIANADVNIDVANDKDMMSNTVLAKENMEAMQADSLENEPMLLSQVEFEHKQCLLDQDCQLLVNTCETCDCVQVVAAEHANKYASEMQHSDIQAQCTQLVSRCDHGYCQIVESATPDE